MRIAERTENYLRCNHCGGRTCFDDLLETEDEGRPEFPELAAFRCQACGNRFVEIVPLEQARGYLLQAAR